LYRFAASLAAITAHLSQIFALFFAVVQVYACAGTLFLGLRDPLHFGYFSSSLLSLYSVTTGEWTDLFQSNLFGCVEYDTGSYTLKLGNTSNTSSIVMWDVHFLSRELGRPDIENQATRNQARSLRTGSSGEGFVSSEPIWEIAECAKPQSIAGQAVVVIYFFSFIIFTVFVLYT
jgi:hypothetical protein